MTAEWSTRLRGRQRQEATEELGLLLHRQPKRGPMSGPIA